MKLGSDFFERLFQFEVHWSKNVPQEFFMAQLRNPMGMLPSGYLT